MRSSKEMRSPPVIMSCTTESTGRVRHDERGAAVWEWTIDTGAFEALSATGVLRHLEVANLKMQESPRLAVAGRDAGGGGDPYNSRVAVPLRIRNR
jgi:hypothetical protein